MRITLRFRDDDARTVAYYLRRRYKARSTARLERLAMVAIRREVASEAQKELDETEEKGEKAMAGLYLYKGRLLTKLQKKKAIKRDKGG